MKVRSLFALCLAGNFLCPGTGIALEAKDIFKLAEPSIVVVLASSAKDGKNVQGSGVVIAPLEILTSCKLLESAADIVISQGNTLRIAKLHYRDTARDLCQLHIDDPLPSGRAAALAPSSKDLEIGQDVYTVGSPQGLDKALERSMISALRETTGSSGRLIQIDAIQASGSTGGGVFDQQGRLVGIITPQFRQSESKSYVVPVEWIADLGKVNPDLMAAAPVAANPAPSTPQAVAQDTRPAWMPRIGDRWKYRLLDGKQAVGIVVVEIVDARDRTVNERITRQDQKGFFAERGVAAEISTAKFQDIVTLPGGYQLTEIAPYVALGQDISASQLTSGLPVTLLLGGYGYGKQQFQTETRVMGPERVQVPAGSFDAVRVQVTGRKSMGSNLIKIMCNYWYSRDSMRTVKMSLEIKYSSAAFQSNSETYELVSFESAH